MLRLVIFVGAWQSDSVDGHLYGQYAQSFRNSTLDLAKQPASDVDSVHSDGVSEEIIQRLSHGANLKLIGRTSSFQFRDERKSEAAQALNCSHVLDGSIRRASDRVRVNAHLVEAQSGTTLWTDGYDRDLEDIFAVQDDISESIAGALNHAFSSFSSRAVEPEIYDLYLHAWLRFYQPFEDRAASAALVAREVERALTLDSQNVDALVANLFVIAPFGQFVDADIAMERIRRAPGVGDGKKYVGWFMRNFGHVRESLVEDERIYASDPLDPMAANVAALARMAVGHIEDAIPVYEDLMARIPDMSFPFSSLLRAKAFLEDWDGVDELLELSKERPLREFEEGLAFIRTKRDPSPENMGNWRRELETHVSNTGWTDCSRLVYAAHLGLLEEAYEIAERARFGPAGTDDDIMGPDGYRTSMLFQARMPELRNDVRFVRLCARLGLVEFWIATGKWPDCADEVPYDFKAECEKAQRIPKEEFGF